MVSKEIDFFKGFTLRFNWTAFEKMAHALNAPAFSQFDKIMANLGPYEIRMILWAGLLHKNPNLKKEDVGELIDEYMETHSMEELTEVIMTALTEGSVFGGKKADTGEAQKSVQ
jgi:hypothetical protein